jgi:hypothetical protein
MFASIFILILLLPAVCLPLALDTFFSSSDLDEMGICLESSDDTLPIQEDVWGISKPLHACPLY